MNSKTAHTAPYRPLAERVSKLEKANANLERANRALATANATLQNANRAKS